LEGGVEGLDVRLGDAVRGGLINLFELLYQLGLARCQYRLHALSFVGLSGEIGLAEQPDQVAQLETQSGELGACDLVLGLIIFLVFVFRRWRQWGPPARRAVLLLP